MANLLDPLTSLVSTQYFHRFNTTNMMNPRVSVVLPVLNAATYLRAALRSLSEQSFSDYELVVIDDGSTDQSGAIIDAAAQLDPRVRVIRNKMSIGMGHVFNLGLFAAKGEYVARMDGDDVAHPERLARQVAFLDAHPEVVVVGAQVELIDVSGSVVGTRSYLVDDGPLRRAMARVSPFAHPVTMFRRELAVHLGGYDVRYAPAEDLHLWVRLAKCGLMANLPDVLLRYRVHDGSVTARQGLRMQWQSLRVRLLAARRHGLQMNRVDAFLAVAQLGAAPLPYRLRMALFEWYRRSSQGVARLPTLPTSAGWLPGE